MILLDNALLKLFMRKF